MRIYTYFALFCVSLILASCSDNEDNNISSPTEEVVPGTNHHVLIAYFSEPLPDGVDANTSPRGLFYDICILYLFDFQHCFC